MFYSIIGYDQQRLIANVKVSSTSTRVNTGVTIPVSIENMQSQSDFEKAVYVGYVQSVVPRDRAAFNVDLENWIVTNTNAVNAFSIPIVPIGTAQSSSSDTEDSTSTTNVTVL
jgi:hypothetical protein